jgi:hypothetical protein
VHLNYALALLGKIMLDYLSHETAVGEVSHDVFFGLGKGHVVHPLVELLQGLALGVLLYVLLEQVFIFYK